MKYRISHLISRDVFPIHDDSGNCVLVATRDEATRIALHLVELINEPIDWPSQPKQCAEFKVLDIGECDRCTFVVGHEGRHSFEPATEGASTRTGKREMKDQDSAARVGGECDVPPAGSTAQIATSGAPTLGDYLAEIRRVRARCERLERVIATGRPEVEALRDIATRLKNEITRREFDGDQLGNDYAAVRALLPGNDDLPSLTELGGMWSEGADCVEAALQATERTTAEISALDPVARAPHAPSTRDEKSSVSVAEAAPPAPHQDELKHTFNEELFSAMRRAFFEGWERGDDRTDRSGASRAWSRSVALPTANRLSLSEVASPAPPAETPDLKRQNENLLKHLHAYGEEMNQIDAALEHCIDIAAELKTSGHHHAGRLTKIDKLKQLAEAASSLPCWQPDLDHLDNALGLQIQSARSVVGMGGMSDGDSRYYAGKADGIEQARKSLGYARDPNWKPDIPAPPQETP